MSTVLYLAAFVVGIVGTAYTASQTAPVEGSLIFPLAILIGAAGLLHNLLPRRKP